MRSVVVTEGTSDKNLLEKILGSQANVVVTSASGHSAAISLVSSLLSLRTARIALVVDADTNDDKLIREREEFLKSILGRNAFEEGTCRLFVFKPEIEIVFFQHRQVFEQVLGKTLKEEEWSAGQLEPRRTLEKLIALPRTQFFSQLPDDMAQRLKSLPVFTELIHFLNEREEPVFL